jgi:hypothetical protein
MKMKPAKDMSDIELIEAITSLRTIWRADVNEAIPLPKTPQEAYKFADNFSFKNILQTIVSTMPSSNELERMGELKVECIRRGITN